MTPEVNFRSNYSVNALGPNLSALPRSGTRRKAIPQASDLAGVKRISTLTERPGASRVRMNRPTGLIYISG